MIRNGKSCYVNKDGYVMIYEPDYPNTRSGAYVTEHRLVMEKHLGRYLTKDEIVHHINGDKQDNRIENLKIMTNSEHIKLHYPIQYRYKVDPRWEREL